MKYTTPALINNTKKLKGFRAFFVGQAGIASYYRARHKTDDVLLLWLEASQFGKLQCFPCVLEEQGDPMVFEVMKGVNTKMRNADLVQRWGLFATPQNINEEYEVEEMEKEAFYQLFGDYRKRAVQKEIERETAALPPEKAAELAAQLAKEEAPAQKADAAPQEPAAETSAEETGVNN